MVKEKKEVPEVCLDYRKPLAREYNDRVNEQVTEPDTSLSLTQMVMTGTVRSSNPNYIYPELPEDDEEAHDHPDYEKLDKQDIVEKEQFVENWLEKPENYEKSETPEGETSGTETPRVSKEAKGADDPE